MPGCQNSSSPGHPKQEFFMSRLTLALLPFLLTLAIAPGLDAQASSDLSDPEVAHVAVTANSIDIELAKFAQPHLGSESVRKFAVTMVTDHSAVNEQAAALATKLGVTPKDNPVSQSLLKGATGAKASLEKIRGAAFDRAYMDREVAYHQAVLDALDGLLIPTTSNAELKKLLVEVRPAIAAHLAHAKKLQSSLVAAK
jgi:putative membrane protein